MMKVALPSSFNVASAGSMVAMMEETEVAVTFLPVEASAGSTVTVISAVSLYTTSISEATTALGSFSMAISWL